MLSKEIRAILDDRNLTLYGASQIIGAETDEELKTIFARLTRWGDRDPKWWTDLTATLGALGYRIQIVKNTDKNI